MLPATTAEWPERTERRVLSKQKMPGRLNSTHNSYAAAKKSYFPTAACPPKREERALAREPAEL